MCIRKEDTETCMEDENVECWEVDRVYIWLEASRLHYSLLCLLHVFEISRFSVLRSLPGYDSQAFIHTREIQFKKVTLAKTELLIPCSIAARDNKR